jgi:CO dehydrogenase nickel-insertion accessory protein CooC1
MNDEVDEDTVTMKKQYKILDSGVFNHLIVGCMKNMGEILDALINRDKSTETEYVSI